ncbi:Enteropeptidase-like Protein [Tribolium castaneum]|uniref:Enteropeptidase-like Protein n=1 Tax=Tribolium castaneum TaxID=7070 RepID=A0A139WGT0_TRICA|nr:PREDICTED: trypsin-3-like [Tribolium castaneum]KYB27106.1 Enteropeptidase-like Protein [Tribolium castaneum]|eukprot:XP_008194538.1 PREDICTED: trypsin-3-like [Tribolium castaneum]
MVALTACLFFLFATEAMSMLNGAPKPTYKNDILAIKHIKDSVVLKSCIGVEISTFWVLSSALCLHSNISDKVVVEARVNEEKVLRYTNTEVKIHPDYDKMSGNNDIGVLHIKGGKHIEGMGQHLILPFAHFPKMNGSISAWNLKSGGYSQIVESLEAGHLKVNIYLMTDCKLQFPQLDAQAHLHGDYQICTFPMVEGSDLCEPDSGAPLYSYHKFSNRWGLIGIYNDIMAATTGRTHQCNQEHRHPLIFTQIFHYFGWISNVTKIPYEVLKGTNAINKDYK